MCVFLVELLVVDMVGEGLPAGGQGTSEPGVYWLQPSVVGVFILFSLEGIRNLIILHYKE